VPTVRELGYPILEADGWNGFFVPAKTPREVVDRLQKETCRGGAPSRDCEAPAEIGAEPVGSTPAEQDAILKRQVAQFRPVIKEMKIEN
jgi:tripartite-type tricarboxylate transporter receptor subunit TctC